MPPRRAKAANKVSADVDMADADDVPHAVGTIALELASARSKLQDAIDRVRDLNHVDLPPESTYAHVTARAARDATIVLRVRDRALTTMIVFYDDNHRRAQGYGSSRLRATH